MFVHLPGKETQMQQQTRNTVSWNEPSAIDWERPSDVRSNAYWD